MMPEENDALVVEQVMVESLVVLEATIVNHVLVTRAPLFSSKI